MGVPVGSGEDACRAELDPLSPVCSPAVNGIVQFYEMFRLTVADKREGNEDCCCSRELFIRPEVV